MCGVDAEAGEDSPAVWTAGRGVRGADGRAGQRSGGHSRFRAVGRGFHLARGLRCRPDPRNAGGAIAADDGGVRQGRHRHMVEHFDTRARNGARRSACAETSDDRPDG